MAEVILENVTKIYNGGVRAVADANLHIADSEFMVLVGPSGCGKSTLLRMIAGLEEITEGTIKIGDRIVNDLSPADRDIGMVFQNYALYPHMTIRRNMEFPLRMRRMDRAEIDSRVAEAAEILGISEYLDRKPKALSGGQRQRVALGRAIVRKPAVFLFDEPLSNLDAKLRVKMRAEISQLHTRLKTTMIYVTHDQVEAMTMGDRIAVINDGIIQQVDRPLELYSRPVNVFVAGFIGSPAMNFMRGRFTGGNIEVEGLSIPLDKPFDKRASAEVIVGVRPEDIIADSENPLFEGEIEVVEPMGNEVFLTFRYRGKEMTARVAPDINPKPGDKVGFRFRTKKLHLFDGETEERIGVNNS
ncbi:sugar ABC transporter ATP-binding protein [bacterium]|nr:MAG: sugar ABC transporter ATP-binding protein [bacterium]